MLTSDNIFLFLSIDGSLSDIFGIIKGIIFFLYFLGIEPPSP
jgi:hypothetical protein